MATVEPGTAHWLREGAKYFGVQYGAVAAAWADRAVESEILTPLATKAAAEAEGARQLAFLATPLAIDMHVVPGLRRDLLGKPITIEADGLGYEAGRDVFVIDFEEAPEVEMTVIRVLVRLD